VSDDAIRAALDRLEAEFAVIAEQYAAAIMAQVTRDFPADALEVE
jgi:DNA-binding GntR family transcriptional regulator